MGLILLALLSPGLVGATLILLSHRLGSRTAVGGALLATLGALAATVAAVATHARIDRPWAGEIGLGWIFESDMISAPLLVLTAGISVLVVLHGLRHAPTGGTPGLYYGLLLLIEFGALSTFWTRDLIVFFIAFEIVLVPMWVLIHRFGDDHDPAARRVAALRFVLYTALGSSIMLAGILAIVTQVGSSDMRAILAAPPQHSQMLIATLLVLGLGVKVPLWPVHSWLPPAHTIAPTAGSVLLAAILLKMGTYGLIRVPLTLTPDGFARVAPLLATLGVVGIIWGGLICLVERDLKRLIAYSSVAHMGFVALALGTNSELGLRAALIANLAHGVISALLFFVVGSLKERWGSVDLAVVRPALRETWPGLGFAVMVGLAASLGLPGLAGFWGEFLAIAAAWNPAGGGTALAVAQSQVSGGSWVVWAAEGAVSTELAFRGLAIVAALGAVLAAAYSLRVAKVIWMGDAAPRDRAGDLSWVELVIVAALILAILALGLFPYAVLPSPSGPAVLS